MKTEVWAHIYQLIKPHRTKFILTVVITLLSTLVNLVEPLIYREAINDIAGLFVEEARRNAQQEISAGYGREVDPITNYVEKKVATVENKIVSPKSSAPEAVHVKHPHTRTHVAGRTPGETLQTLIWAVSILFLLSVIGYILWLIGDNMNIRLSCLIEQRFIKGAFAHVLKLPLGFFSKRSPAAISKQIDQSEQVTEIVGALAQQIMPEILSLIGILTIMLWQNATLTLIAIAVIPIYVFIAWSSSQKLETSLDTFYERWEEVSGRISGALNGIKTVKLSGAEIREIKEYEKISDLAYDNYIQRSLLANKFTFLQRILVQVSNALVLGYGGYLALGHKITPGDVVMFVSYLDRLYSPIDELSSLWVTIQQNIASISRAFRLLDNNVEEKKGTPLVVTRGEVEFRNINFSYSAERTILKGLSVKFQPAKITAIVGGSGAGKTTTVDLLLKLYEPQSGEILIDGRSLKDIDPSSIRAQIGMVATDAAIFSGTLADNIRYKKPSATLKEIKFAAEQAGLANTISRLPDGLKTMIGQNGMGLSVGEKQRVNIARVILSKPKILILDEATANLDYNTEAEVKKAINHLRQDCTIIIVAHRYSMVYDADYAIVLSEGRVIESGPPEHLIKQKGWFSDFANSSHDDKPAELTDDTELEGKDDPAEI